MLQPIGGGEGLPVKRSEEIVEILEAYDLTGSYCAAAELAGCDHHTVARYVALRAAGRPPVAREHRARPIDEYLDKIEELVARSNGRVRDCKNNGVTPILEVAPDD
jgi:hypothetical protein